MKARDQTTLKELKSQVEKCRSDEVAKRASWELDHVISVPVAAVVRDAGKDHVAVKKSDGQFEWRDVTLGQSNQWFVAVKKGMKTGELVAIQPRALLSEKS